MHCSVMVTSLPPFPLYLDKNRKLLHEAMKEGHVNARTAKVLIHGIAGSGKTSTKHVIFEDEPSKIRQSTPLAERPIKAVRVDTKSSKWRKIGPKKMAELLAKSMVSYGSSKKHPPSRSLSHLGIHPKTRPSTLRGTREPDSSPRQKHTPEAVLKTEKKLVQLMGQVSGSNFVLELDFIHFIDSGGQPQFLEVLPIFLRGTSVYMAVTNLSEMFDQYPMVKYYESGNLVCKPYPAAHTNKEILQQCITTMQSQGSQAARGNVNPPKIMIIGTHSDKEHECNETRETKNKNLLKMLLPTFQKEIIYSSRDMKQLIFALNAKTPGEPEYKITDEIRREIMKCFPQPDKIPLRWYALELLLKEMAESEGRYVLSIGDCFIVAQQLHFDEESFKAALEYLDKLNILYYYPKILPNVVFCDPQVLLDKLTELVKFSYKLKGGSDPNETKAYDGQHQRFRDHGLVTSRFLEAFDKHYIPELFTAEDLIRLFKDLLILADFEESTYFMPCVLEVLSSEKVAKYRLTTSSAADPLAIHFPSGPRSGVFCLLMTFLRSSDNHFPRPWELWLDGNTPSCLYRNCVEFVIPRFAGSIVLINSFAFFEIYIRSARPESVPQLCTFIQKAVFAGLNKAAATLHYVEMKPEAALVCPCGEGDVHPAILGDGPSFWICTNNQHTSDALTEKQLLWFSPTSTTSGEYSVCLK